MSEIIQKVENALVAQPQMTRYRALETMERRDYNPVEELIELAGALKKARKESYRDDGIMSDPELELKIHFKLLEYYSAAPKKQMSLDVQSQQQVVVMPVNYGNLMEGKDLTPCKPALIDVTPEKTALEELMDGNKTAPPNPKSR